MEAARPFFIPVILGTTRKGRMSAHAARLMADEIARRPGVETQLIDILKIPMALDDAGEGIKDPQFSTAMNRADALVIVSPLDTGRTCRFLVPPNSIVTWNATTGDEGAACLAALPVVENGQQFLLGVVGDGIFGQLAQGLDRLPHLGEIVPAARAHGEMSLKVLHILGRERPFQVVSDQLYQLLAGHSRWILPHYAGLLRNTAPGRGGRATGPGVEALVG